MAPSLTTLPCEIMHEILCHCTTYDLARARLVSSHFREPASRLLFRKLTLWHNPQSAANVASVIAAEDLRSYVRELCFSVRTSNNTSDLYAFLDSSNALPAQLLQILRRVNLLDNLTVLRCLHEFGPNRYFDVNLADRYDTYRGEVLTTLIGGLAERGATSRKLEVLGIFNLSCRSQPYLTDHPSFSALLRTLKALYLRFDYKSENNHLSWDATLAGRLRDFFSRLPQAWLAPAATHLTYLGLSASGPWGYLLKVDFRGVHFPRLKSLFLKDFLFSHDWQLDWILSHTSLQEMRLIQCSILIHAYWYGEKDNEGYPINVLSVNENHERYPDNFLSTREQNYRYARRWHHYYQHFSSLLGNLRFFTTEGIDGSTLMDCVGGYQTYHEYDWIWEIPEPDRRAEDEEALKHLKATTNRRSRQ